VVVVDVDGRIGHINHTSSRLSAGREGIIGRRICDLLAPEYRVPMRESIEAVFRTGETIRQGVGCSADGNDAACCEACIGPITQNGRVIAVGMFFTDITERERLQTRLRERERLLRSIVRAVPRMMDILEGLIRHGADVDEPARRSQELELCREQMLQIGRLASIGKASSSLMQRLPQFLTAIGMSIENAQAKLDAASCHDGAGRELEAALRAVSTLAMGVDQVRGFAETGSRQPLVHAVDLGASLARAVQLLEAGARGASTVFSIEPREEWPAVRMAEGDAEQLCFALIENLIRFADGKRNHRIVVRSVVKEHDIELQFSGDEGLVAQDDVEVALDRPCPAEAVAQAADLGLYVAWDIVVRAGGTIHRERTAGPARTFFVSLPIVDQVSRRRGQSGGRRKTTGVRRR
jgi:PAS domain S-box-containing protein